MTALLSKLQDHSVRHTTLGRTALERWSTRKRDFYLTTHNTHKDRFLCPGGIRTRIPSKTAAAHPPLQPHSHWDRLIWLKIRPVISSLWKLQWISSSHKMRNILLTIWRNFSLSRKIKIRGVHLLFRSYFQLLIKMNDWEIEWKLSVGIGSP